MCALGGQDKNKDYKTQIAELNEKLEAVTAEKEKLEMRNNLLEKLAQLRSDSNYDAQQAQSPEVNYFNQISQPMSKPTQWGAHFYGTPWHIASPVFLILEPFQVLMLNYEVGSQFRVRVVVWESRAGSATP